MEILPGEDGFKHLPLRMFERDQAVRQRLYKTMDSQRQKTLRDLIKEAWPEKKEEEGKTKIGK